MPDCLGTGPRKFPRLDEAISAPMGALNLSQPRPYYVVNEATLH